MAALGGLLMASMRFSGMPHPPAWLAMGHGFLAAAGLTLLTYAVLTTSAPASAQIALGLLLFAAGGGVVMNLLFHNRQKPLPIPLMILHALLALIALTLLLACFYDL
jgi:predicted membrane channel-forming protein YqfA (hemolysin III family)